MFAKPDEIDSPAAAGRQPASSGLSLLSRSGPEVPPDVTAGLQPEVTTTRYPDVTASPQPGATATPQSGDTATQQSDATATQQSGLTATQQPDAMATPRQGATATRQSDLAGAPQSCLVESTDTLPIIAAASRKPPGVAARAVIVYENPPRRPWRLWAFTAVLVALTIGVVLGQAVAWQPVSRTAAVAEAQVVPTPPPTPPGPGLQVAAPLGSARTRLLEVAGTATVVHIRSMDLGATLFHAAAVDTSSVPSWSDTGQGTRLELARTGAPGTAGLDIQLNTRVSWTIRLTAGTAEQDIDMRAGGLAGLQLTGGHSLMVLRLPEPKGTVPLYIGGTVSRLNLAAGTGALVRLRLARAAGVVTVDEAKQRTPVTPAGWKSARNRYDLSSYATIDSLAVTHR